MAILKQNDENNIDILLSAISRKMSSVQLKNCARGSFQDIFNRAIEKEPRIIAFLKLDKIQYEISRGSIISLLEDYTIKLLYKDNVSKLDDIFYLRTFEEANNLIDKISTDVAYIVGESIQPILDKLQDVQDKKLLNEEGFDHIWWESFGYHKYQCLELNMGFVCDEKMRKQKQFEVSSEVFGIINKLRCNSIREDFIKIYLVFSYVTQNCKYLRENLQHKQSQSKLLPYPDEHMAYGPLKKHKGDSFGIAWSVKKLLDAMNIENLLIYGAVKNDFENSQNYMWNLVKIDGKYYHLDASWNIDMKGIFINGFLKGDREFSFTHGWNTELYPAAGGGRYNYDYVENYLRNNGRALLNMGIPIDIVFPEPVNEL